ncbi:MAG: hypothetical protein M0D55_14090 [Elusimicrobiota bacterium]|nr:MAG: hypothetical protein M0D55_14090 [Elusimicrobiota bacterium]
MTKILARATLAQTQKNRFSRAKARIRREQSMDTKKDSAASDVPTFKVARVGNDRKRKGAGFSFLRSGGSRGGFSGATGGSGSGGGLGGLLGGAGGGAGAQAGFFASKFVQAMLSVMLAGGIGSAAIYIGAMSTQTDEPAKKAAPFVAKEDVKLEGDITNLPGDPNAIPNSLGYLSGSMDGLTPEERAKRAAEEAARKAAEEEAARKAEEEAARTAANPAVDPNALLASAQADGQNKGGGLGRKFGNLSSSFGGGSSLAGGAGMAGGVGRSFGAGGGSIKGGARGSLSKASTTAKPSFPAPPTREGRAAT